MVLIKEFDHVVLKDGREGAIVHVFGDDQTEFLVDVGSSPADWETIVVKREDIIRVERQL